MYKNRLKMVIFRLFNAVYQVFDHHGITTLLLT